MVAKKRSGKKSSKVKVGKLKLNKETVKDLTDREVKGIKGGMPPTLMATRGQKCTQSCRDCL